MTDITATLSPTTADRTAKPSTGAAADTRVSTARAMHARRVDVYFALFLVLGGISAICAGTACFGVMQAGINAIWAPAEFERALNDGIAALLVNASIAACVTALGAAGAYCATQHHWRAMRDPDRALEQ